MQTGVEFVLKALGYGAMGVAAIVLCLSYLLVRQLVSSKSTGPAAAGRLQLVQKYMRFALVCTAAMVALQVADQVVKIYTDKKLLALESRVLSPQNFRAIREWHWHWGEGGWETKGAFISTDGEGYRFAATTLYKANGNSTPIMRWESTEPVRVTEDGADIEFLGKRTVIADEALCTKLNLGPRQEYRTRFRFKRSFALTGTYSGGDGAGPFGDIMLYAAMR
jgi:hypothetical protein